MYTNSNNLVSYHVSVYTWSNFEDGLGGFIQDETDDMDWSLWSSSTPSLDTGPPFDHTYGNSSGTKITPCFHSLTTCSDLHDLNLTLNPICITASNRNPINKSTGCGNIGTQKAK